MLGSVCTLLLHGQHKHAGRHARDLRRSNGLSWAAQVMRKCVAYADGEYSGLTTIGKPGGYLYTVA